MNMDAVDPKAVAIVVPERAQSLDVSGPLDALLEANRQAPDRSLYAVRLLSTGHDRTVKAGGMSLIADGSIVTTTEQSIRFLSPARRTTPRPIRTRTCTLG